MSSDDEYSSSSRSSSPDLTKPFPAVTLVNTLALLSDCLSSIDEVEVIAVDFQGRDLSRSGTLSLIQLFHEEDDTVWLVDVTALGGKKVLEYTGSNGEGYTSLKEMFENRDVRKLMFDCRADVDCLYGQFKVHFAGVFDVQMQSYEWYNRNEGEYTFLPSLAKSMGWASGDLRLDKKLKTEKGPDAAGHNFANFDVRPLDPVLIQYAAQDVAVIWHIYHVLGSIVRKKTDSRVMRFTKSRVEESERGRWVKGSRENARVSCFW